jgi:prophage regulatory protein
VSAIPEIGFLRLSQIIGDLKADPPIIPIVPVSRSSWWQGVKTGRYPQPVKLGPRTTVWLASDIRNLIQGASVSADDCGSALAAGDQKLANADSGTNCVG